MRPKFTLSRHLSFELAVGINGAVWIKAVSAVECIAIRMLITKCDSQSNLSDIQIEALVEVLVERLKENAK